MFDIWSLILGVIIGGAGGVAAMALVHYSPQPDDDPEYWFKQLGRRNSDKL